MNREEITSWNASRKGLCYLWWDVYMALARVTRPWRRKRETSLPRLKIAPWTKAAEKKGEPIEAMKFDTLPSQKKSFCYRCRRPGFEFRLLHSHTKKPFVNSISLPAFVSAKMKAFTALGGLSVLFANTIQDWLSKKGQKSPHKILREATFVVLPRKVQNAERQGSAIKISRPNNYLRLQDTIFPLFVGQNLRRCLIVLTDTKLSCAERI